METNQKIKVGYDAQTGLYVLQPGYLNNLSINGKSITNPLTGAYKAHELYVTSEKPEVVSYQKTGRELSEYENTETGQIISIPEYKNIEVEINKGRTWDEDREEYIYDSIEDEIKSVRFFRSHKPVYKEINTIYYIDVEIIEYPVSAYKNIIPLYSLDAKNIFETKCKFIPNNIEMFYEVCEQYGIEKGRIDIPTHSGLRFVKIDDVYLTGAEDFEKFAANTLIATYEECIARMNNIRKKLEDMVVMHLAKHPKKVLDKATVGELLKELLIVKSRVSNLDVKQKDYSSQRSVVSKINEMIEIYKQLA
jgi:hypothetical protein